MTFISALLVSQESCMFLNVFWTVLQISPWAGFLRYRARIILMCPVQEAFFSRSLLISNHSRQTKLGVSEFDVVR